MVAIASETKTPFLAPQMMFGALLFKGGILKINSIHCKIDFKNPKCYPNTASDCNFVFVPANGISCLSSNQVIIYMFNYKIFIFSVCFQLIWWMYLLLILLTFSSNEMLSCFPFSFSPLGPGIAFFEREAR